MLQRGDSWGSLVGSLKESNMFTCQDSLQACLLLPIPVWLSLECKIGGKSSGSTEVPALVRPLQNLP